MAGRWVIHAEDIDRCPPDFTPEYSSHDEILYVQQTGCTLYGYWTNTYEDEEYSVNLWGSVSNNQVDFAMQSFVFVEGSGWVHSDNVNLVATGRVSDGYVEGTLIEQPRWGDCYWEGTFTGRIERDVSQPSVSVLEGVVRDAQTGGPIAGAAVSLSPSQLPSTSTGIDGSFSFTDVPVGTYTVIASASNYRDASQEVTIVADQTSSVALCLEPTAPSVTASISPSSASPGRSVTLTAQVSDPDGIEDIVSVTVNLCTIGFYENTTLTESNGTWSVTLTVPDDAPIGQRVVRVTARDSCGAAGYGDASLEILADVRGTVSSDQPERHALENPVQGQTLIFDYGSGGASRIIRQECVTQLTITGPDGSIYGPYDLTASGQVLIENAAAGTWSVEVQTTCPQPASYSFRVRGSGTGVVAGVVRNRRGRLLPGVNVTSDLGGAAMTVNGRYLMVLPAGVHTLTADAGFISPNSSMVTVEAGSTADASIDVQQIKPAMWLELDKTSYRSGETPVIKISLFCGTSGNTVDLYLVLERPDGTFYQFGTRGEVAGPTVPSFDVIELENFEIQGCTIDVSAATGTWTYYGAFAQPGTWDLVGAFCTAPFQAIH